MIPHLNREPVLFKGNKHGVSIHLDEQADFSDILADLRNKLAPARQFFGGAMVRLHIGHRPLGPQERAVLEQTVQEFGLVMNDQVPENDVPSPAPVVRPPVQPVDRREDGDIGERTVLVRRTLRSGQKLDYDGNIVILGDVNPGAEVVCKGDIVVLGALRGVAHAGAGGNPEAVVMAFRLEPTQLRIAHYISRAPDGKLQPPLGPEIARVRDDLIQITSYQP